MMRKAAIEEAIAFGNKSITFSLEDTVDRCYRDVVDVLQAHSWKRVPYRKRSKVEKRKIPSRDAPKLVWTLNDKDIDFGDLQDDQLCNHFEGISRLTTKQGFCELVRESPLIGENGLHISPRAYNLGDSTHRDEFIDDFRLTAAVNILKLFLCHRHAIFQDRPYGVVEQFATMSEDINRIIRLCIWAVTWSLRVHHYGEWPGVDISKHFKDRDEPLQDHEWHDVVEFSYKLVSCESKIEWTTQCEVLGIQSKSVKALLHRHYSPLDFKVRQILTLFYKIQPQTLCEGYRNIWIVKAPDASCGKNMRVLHTLDEILDVERGMKGRTVQKYIEHPLTHDGYKFDLRVWVLVTSWDVNALQAYIYRRVYGRRCVEAYTADVRTLPFPAYHLTNYSVQKKLRPSTASASSTAPASTASNAYSSSGMHEGEDLLVHHEEVERIVQQSLGHLFRSEKQPHYGGDHVNGLSASPSPPVTSALNEGHAPLEEDSDIWRHHIWPRITARVAAVLALARPYNQPRENSFQFLGFDILLDARGEPYVLEVNLSPAMAHRGVAQSETIRRMVEGLVQLAIVPKLDSITAALWNQADVQSNNNNKEEREGEGEAEVRMNEWEALPQHFRDCYPRHSFLRRKARKGQEETGTNGGGPAQTAPGLGLAFVLQGRGLTEAEILTRDTICTLHSSLQKLQRWMRASLRRLDAWQRRQRHSCLMIQCWTRVLRAKRCQENLRRVRACARIQRAWRGHHARQVLQALRREAACVAIQCLVRQRQAKHHVQHRREAFAARRIGRWLCGLWRRRLWQGLRTLLRLGQWRRRWKQYCARKIRSLLRLYYRVRARRARTIQRTVRRWQVRRKLWIVYQREHCRHRSELALLAFYRRQERMESAKMAQEDGEAACKQCLQKVLERILCEEREKEGQEGREERTLSWPGYPQEMALSEKARIETLTVEEFLALSFNEHTLAEEHVQAEERGDAISTDRSSSVPNAEAVAAFVSSEVDSLPIAPSMTVISPPKAQDNGDEMFWPQQPIQAIAPQSAAAVPYPATVDTFDGLNVDLEAMSQRLLAKYSRPALAAQPLPPPANLHPYSLPPEEEAEQEEEMEWQRQGPRKGEDWSWGMEERPAPPSTRPLARSRPYLPDLPIGATNGLEDFFAQTFLRASISPPRSYSYDAHRVRPSSAGCLQRSVAHAPFAPPVSIQHVAEKVSAPLPTSHTPHLRSRSATRRDGGNSSASGRRPSESSSGKATKSSVRSQNSGGSRSSSSNSSSRLAKGARALKEKQERRGEELGQPTTPNDLLRELYHFYL